MSTAPVVSSTGRALADPADRVAARIHAAATALLLTLAAAAALTATLLGQVWAVGGVALAGPAARSVRRWWGLRDRSEVAVLAWLADRCTRLVAAGRPSPEQVLTAGAAARSLASAAVLLELADPAPGRDPAPAGLPAWSGVPGASALSEDRLRDRFGPQWRPVLRVVDQACRMPRPHRRRLVAAVDLSGASPLAVPPVPPGPGAAAAARLVAACRDHELAWCAADGHADLARFWAAVTLTVEALTAQPGSGSPTTNGDWQHAAVAGWTAVAGTPTPGPDPVPRPRPGHPA